MGNRSNITFHFDGYGEEPPADVNVYFHWAGRGVFDTLKEAIGSATTRERWNDPEYFTRVVVHKLLVNHADPDSATGVGIAPWPGDGQETIAHVYVDRQQVQILDGPELTYEEFVTS